MLRKIILSVCCAAIGMAAAAKVRLPHIISDGMVIEQNTDVNFWGWASPGKAVKVTTSWTKDKQTVTADKSGRWSIKVHSPKAGFTPLSITFNDGDRVTVNNILSGEVWLCGGQSNMEMPMEGWDNCPTKGYNDEMLAAGRHGGIHVCTIPRVWSDTIHTDADCSWKAVSAATLGEASATAYYFARTLYETLNIPVGIIVACRGGSTIEAWLTPENVKANTDLPLEIGAVKKRFGNWDSGYPACWYRGTLYPTIGYTVKGFIYYQGCSNVGSPVGYYSKLMKVLVDQWRKDFGSDKLPFYFVQISPYIYSNADDIPAALLRDEQYKASKMISNCGMVCTEDLVYPWETHNIHPAQKDKVGQRLATLALKHDYGYSALLTENAEYESMSISHDTVTVKLRNMYRGFYPTGRMTGFEVAGDDKAFHDAEAWTVGKNVVQMRCAAVKNPVAVRYCFRNFKLGDVHNSAGLPLVPFRTDNW